MATFIVLIDYTEQGIQRIRDAPKRAAGFAEAAQKLGITVKEVYWTMGSHDGVLILDAPDDQTATKLLLSLAQAGNVRTHTLRAYERSEIESILADIG